MTLINKKRKISTQSLQDNIFLETTKNDYSYSPTPKHLASKSPGWLPLILKGVNSVACGGLEMNSTEDTFASLVG